MATAPPAVLAVTEHLTVENPPSIASESTSSIENCQIFQTNRDIAVSETKLKGNESGPKISVSESNKKTQTNISSVSKESLNVIEYSNVSNNAFYDSQHDSSDETDEVDAVNSKDDVWSPQNSKPKNIMSSQQRRDRLASLLARAKVYSRFLGERLGKSFDESGSAGDSKFKQPKLIQNVTLRDYQLEGVQWLISLYENGLNGILADDMGLGKTLESVAFLAFLMEQGIQGPFLIVVPLSTLSNWLSEVNRFVPSISAMLYYASDKAGRSDIRRSCPLFSHILSSPSEEFRDSADEFSDSSKHEIFNPQTNKKPKPVHFKSVKKHSHSDFNIKNSPSIIITTYEIAIKDAKYLSQIHWKYLIVDEGHRLKNMDCVLVRELEKYPSDNRLLLTGTPLQNNLTELWSLLHFLLPQIFTDLQDFLAWFDLDFTDESLAETSHSLSLTNKSDQPTAAVNLHTTNSPTTEIAHFNVSSSNLLTCRDNLEVRANEETERNRGMVTQLHAILKPLLLRRLKSDVEQLLPPKREYLIACPLLDPYQKSIYNAVGSDTAREYLTSLDNVQTLNPIQTTNGKRTKPIKFYSEEKLEYEKYSEDDLFAHKIHTINHHQDFPDKKYSHTDTENVDILNHSTVKSNQRKSKEIKTSAHSAPLMNRMMQLRKACNHPALFPVLDTKVSLMDSGKMLILEQLIIRLSKQKHRILIFSQMTRMLDLIEEYLLKKIKLKFCRIDGSVSHVDRENQIKMFKNSEKIPIFLLSTRAGGLGINLTAADTVIFYDSDWNPQVDLQAMDRVHRIGQTKPVIIIRLAAAKTVEYSLLQKVGEKRRLERLVIHRKRFKGQRDALLSPNDEVLTVEDFREVISQAKFDPGSTGTIISAKNQHQLLSDSEMDIILDRSPEAYEIKEYSTDMVRLIT